jgi:hypothetical protein
MWHSVWKHLHVYEGCNLHAESQPIPTNQGWEVLHHHAHKGKSKISLVSPNQAKKLISSSKKYVLFFLRENRSDDESMRVTASVEGCTKEQIH